MPDLETLHANFGTWLEVYAYVNDSRTRPQFTFSVSSGFYSIDLWNHTTPKPTIEDLLKLSEEQLNSYQVVRGIDNFLAQKNPIFESGYVLFWSRIRALEGVKFATNQELLYDLRKSMISHLLDQN